MKRIFFGALALIFLLAGCASASAAGHQATLKEQNINALNTDFVSGINTFGFNAADILYTTDKNLALSPVSITLALLMTRTGAAGDTVQEMADALGQSGLRDDDILNACRSLMWRANTGGMEAANSIWLNDAYQFSDGFVDTCLNDFMADAMPLKIPGATDNINAWISDNTQGKIEKLLEQELPAQTDIVLCNALYYLGEWVLPFEHNDTYDEEFITPDGSVTTTFMHSTRNVPYYEGDTFTMISLDFKQQDGEGSYAMALMLPKKGPDISGMLALLDDTAFQNALNGLEETQAAVKIPKFEYDYMTCLKETLQALGMHHAFADADFSAMTHNAGGLYIEDVYHKCYIRVDELGAEAAAATEVVILRGATPEPSAAFYADRPFAFAIYSKEDGTIAFMGAVNDPTQSS